MHSDDLKSYLPPFLSGTETFLQLFNAVGPEFDNLSTDIADLNTQFDVDTATWALDIYEKELGVATDYAKSLDYRRSVVKSRWRGNGKLNATLIKSVCDAFTNGNVGITFDGTIHVQFTSVIGIPPNMSDLEIAVDKIKPAYLLLDYLFLYTQWSAAETITWATVKAKTWSDLLNGRTV